MESCLANNIMENHFTQGTYEKSHKTSSQKPTCHHSKPSSPHSNRNRSTKPPNLCRVPCETTDFLPPDSDIT